MRPSKATPTVQMPALSPSVLELWCTPLQRASYRLRNNAWVQSLVGVKYSLPRKGLYSVSLEVVWAGHHKQQHEYQIGSSAWTSVSTSSSSSSSSSSAAAASSALSASCASQRKLYRQSSQINSYNRMQSLHWTTVARANEGNGTGIVWAMLNNYMIVLCQ